METTELLFSPNKIYGLLIFIKKTFVWKISSKSKYILSELNKMLIENYHSKSLQITRLIEKVVLYCVNENIMYLYAHFYAYVLILSYIHIDTRVSRCILTYCFE